MSSPDNSLIPLHISDPEYKDIDRIEMNSFQKRIFMQIIEKFDGDTWTHFIQNRSYGKSKDEVNPFKLRQKVLELIDTDDNTTPNGYTLIKKISELLEYSLLGMEHCEPLLDACMRGMLDINEDDYDTLLTFLERYNTNLRLEEITSPSFVADERFLSKRSWFSPLKGYLIDYSQEVAFQRFIAGGRSRIQTLIYKTPPQVIDVKPHSL